MAENCTRVYIPVLVRTDTEGRMRPLSIRWEDGTVYKIDRVSDVRFASSMRHGERGDRYTVWINGRQSYIYFERNYSLSGPNIGRWFVEKRVI